MHNTTYCVNQGDISVNRLSKTQFMVYAKASLAIAYTHRWLKLLPANKTTPSRKRDEVGKLSLKHNSEITLIVY